MDKRTDVVRWAGRSSFRRHHLPTFAISCLRTPPPGVSASHNESNQPFWKYSGDANCRFCIQSVTTTASTSITENNIYKKADLDHQQNANVFRAVKSMRTVWYSTPHDVSSNIHAYSPHKFFAHSFIVPIIHWLIAFFTMTTTHSVPLCGRCL